MRIPVFCTAVLAYVLTGHPPPDTPRPRLIGLLNGPIQWGDTMWAAMIWDTLAPKTPRAGGAMLVHESFHIVQQRLGLGVGTLSAEHLDSVDGRYWMRLEWRALARALREWGEASAPWTSTKASPHTPKPCFPRNPRPTRSRMRSMS